MVDFLWHANIPATLFVDSYATLYHVFVKHTIENEEGEVQMQLMIIILCVPIIAPLLLACINTIVIKAKSQKNTLPTTADPYDGNALEAFADHLATAVTYRTVVMDDIPGKPFMDFHNFLERTFTHIHTQLDRVDVVESRNLVFRWKGTNPEKSPALLMAHQDVVPADEEEWTYPPFSKAIADGYVWGRGSFDAKGQLIAILEAIEELVSNDYHPSRTWYIAFGWDEETRGSRGARSIVEYFASQEIRFAYVLDEGGIVTEGFVPGIKTPIAVVGIAEKGNLNLKISCTKEGGHSSSPRNPTAVGTLARAVWRLETKRNKARFSPPVKMLFRTLGEYAPFHLALPLLNPWLFKPLIVMLCNTIPSMNALVRTTLAVTMVKGSSAENIIANTATAIANIRTLPGDSTEKIITRVKRIISDDTVDVSVVDDSVRSRISRLDGEGFEMISKTIGQVFSAVPTPYLMTGGSDALYYEAVCDHVYRFTPAVMNTSELQRMHNVDERFSLENLGKAVEFYRTLIIQDSQE